MTATAIAPERSRDQRMQALERANEVRSRRAELKRDLKARRREVLEVLADPPAYLETMKVWDLLLGAPKLGRVKVDRTLRLARISPSKRVGGLSPRQRAELTGLLKDRRADP